jgi:hypothetical protein
MPQPGDIFIFKDFTFEDGSQRDKWFVVLNASDLEKPCIALKTTSVPDRYIGCTQGCNRDRRCFYAPVTWQPCFLKDTYIQLPQIFEFSASELFSNRLRGKIEFRPALSRICFEQLKSCIAGFKDDIGTKHWDLIYKVAK